MILLMNHEAVVHECMSIAKGKIAYYLQLPSDWITIQLAIEEGRIKPSVKFAMPEDAEKQYPRARAWTESDASNIESIEAILRQASSDLAIKLKGLDPSAAHGD